MKNILRVSQPVCFVKSPEIISILYAKCSAFRNDNDWLKFKVVWYNSIAFLQSLLIWTLGFL